MHVVAAAAEPYVQQHGRKRRDGDGLAQFPSPRSSPERPISGIIVSSLSRLPIPQVHREFLKLDRKNRPDGPRRASFRQMSIFPAGMIAAD
jgi:hypothetical protein